MNKRYELWIFLAIMTLAIFFRLYKLDILPPGLWPDEAANGVDALKALDSNDFKIFYPANNGREGLFINIQAVSIHFLDANPFALRFVSAIFGILTVAGLYLLTRKIFTWRIAAVASFFMAVSFWHVNFSRIGFRAIMLPFILVWAFYFLWRGLKSGHLREFLIAGIIGGMGFYTYFSFRIAPLIVLLMFWNYWSYLKKDFDHLKYEQSRNQLLRGFALMMLAVIIIAIPLGVYFYTHPEDFLKREGRSISVLDQAEPLRELGISVIKTLAMFNFGGDFNHRHNIPGWPELSLLIGIMFAVGFIKELIHWLRRTHGHFSVTHTFLFSWFFIMLLPGFLSTEAPHALRTIGVIPVVMIFAAQGFWWIVNSIIRYHRVTDFHAQTDKLIYKKESKLLLTLVIISFVSSIGFIEYWRYFKVWANSPQLQEAFVQKYVDMSYYLKGYTAMIPKYILVNEGDVMVDGVPNNAQTIKFLTKTHSRECSTPNNIYYLNSNQLLSVQFPERYMIIPLADNPETQNILQWKLGLRSQKFPSFNAYIR